MPRTTTGRPVFARCYARVAGPGMERAGATEHRRRLLAPLAGEVLELGAGNGLNFPHYPPAVARLVAVEPEPRLRSLAERAARDAPVPVEVVDGTGERLSFPDGSFDGAVVCLTLCSVTDQAEVLRRLHRVLRPGGQLRFFEHVRASTPGMRRAQRVLDATVWPLLAGGCHMGRDTAAAITGAGFALTELDRFAFPDVSFPLPSASHILGTAVREGPGTNEP
ncbi:class I SAM-dependent methyltransferase [Streptomyces chilikensis]|uniref:Class I SAM-dependent methyltransferase n=1 Tax=Streptomyces chilikensis TaxID=1194079 RepID=A0ABV3EJW5_9ACTN